MTEGWLRVVAMISSAAPVYYDEMGSYLVAVLQCDRQRAVRYSPSEVSPSAITSSRYGAGHITIKCHPGGSAFVILSAEVFHDRPCLCGEYTLLLI